MRRREYLFRTEPDPTAARIRQWERQAAECRRAREEKLNGESPGSRVLCELAVAAEEYVARSGHVKAASTLDRLERVLADFCDYQADADGPTHVDDLTVTHIARYRDRLLTRGLSASTVNCYLADLSGWLRWCVGENYCTDNPARKVNRANVKVTDKPLPVQGPAELWQLLGRLDTDVKAATVGLLACTGLRISEAADLRWDGSWDADADILRVGDSPAAEKTKRHCRTLPVVPIMRRFLCVLRMNNDEGPWIIGIRRGQCRITSQVGTWLRPWGCSPHDMRRFFRAGLEELHAPLYIIDDLLGHRSSRIRRAYTPPINVDAARPVMEQLSRWLLAVNGSRFAVAAVSRP